jgi:formamidopyrimidine-DNA glycosylase
MAEMPEVEILVQDLREAVVGKAFAGAQVVLPEAVRFPAPAEFEHLLAGQRVAAAERRAKHILLTLDATGLAGGMHENLVLAMHCMLQGTLRLAEPGAPYGPELLVRYELEDGAELRFMDRLGYARAALGTAALVAEQLKLEALGPEIIAPEFSVATLAARLARRRGPLKGALLNQQVVAGLGNRDTDESLWAAALSPMRPAASLDQAETIRLHAAMRAVVHEGIALRGTMTDLWGRRGAAPHGRHVYGRAGLACSRCGTTIAMLRLGDRATFYCPGCQH